MSTLIPLPPELPFNRARGTSAGSISSLPGDDANIPPVERLTPAQVDLVSTEAVQFAERLKNLIADANAKVEDARRNAVERYAERELPPALRAQRAKEDAADLKKQLRKQIAPQSADLIEQIRIRVVRLDAQVCFLKNPVVLLQSYALQDPALKLMPALQNVGVATLLHYFRTAFAENNVWLGAALLARTGPGGITDADFNRLQASGFDKSALARRLVGSDYERSRDAVRRARTAQKNARAIEYEWRENKPMAHFNLDAAMEEAGNYNDEFMD